MLRRFLRDSVIYGLSAVIGRSLGILFLPVFTRYISPSEYGQLEILTVFGAVIAIIMALEISQAVARFYPSEKSQKQRIAYASTSLWFTVAVFSVFLAVALWKAALFSEWLLDQHDNPTLFRWVSVSIWINGMCYLVQNQLRWDLKTLAYSVSTLLSSVLGVCAAGYFVIVAGQGVLGIVWGQIFGFACGMIYAICAARYLFRLQFSCRVLYKMIHFSAPLVPAAFGTIFSNYIDRVAVNTLMGFSDLGIYSIANRFGAVAGLLILGFQLSLTPLVYQHYKNRKTPEKLAQIFRLFLVLGLSSSVVVGLFSAEIVRLFTASEFHAAEKVVPILFVAVMLSNMYVFAPGIAIAKKTKIIAGITLIAACTNAGFNILLIPVFGLVGAASATMLGAVVTIFGWMYFNQRYYVIPYEWPKLSLSVLVALGVVVVGRVFEFYVWTGFLIKGGLIVGFIAVLVMINMIKDAEIAQLRQSIAELTGSRFRGSGL